MSAIKAITFDLWDTLVADDSDELIRAERGLRSKKDERRHLLWAALKQQQGLPEDAASLTALAEERRASAR